MFTCKTPSVRAVLLNPDLKAYQLEFSAFDIGHIHVVGRRAQVLHLFAGEDVNGNEMNLGVAVLASLGGGHVHDLARAALDHDMTVLAQSRALHGVGRRGAGVGGFEGVLMLERELSASREIGLLHIWHRTSEIRVVDDG